MRTVFLGFDPGADGFGCFLDPMAQEIAFISLRDSNDTEVLEWITHICRDYNVAKAMLEEVHSLYGMSAKSNFSFGSAVGRIQTILNISNVGWDLVQPKVWQKEAGIKFPAKSKPAQKKKITAEVVARLFPGADIYGPKGGLIDGKADALMIAHYCMLRYK